MASDILDVVSIGEGQLRLQSRHGVGLARADNLELFVAGTEGNIVSLLSRLGNSTGLVSALPVTPLGRRIADEYRQAGVDLSAVTWMSEGRVALYFVDPGNSPIPSRVYYDREHSCFAGLTLDDIDQNYLGRARLIHLSGITAALTPALHDVVLATADRARSGHQLLSVDVNYRSLLWRPEVARERLEPIITDADVLTCSRRDARIVFSVDGTAREVAAELAQRFGARTVLVSDGPRAVEVVAGKQHFSAVPPATDIVDRVGAGDALVAGFLHGVLHDDVELGLALGVAAAALTLTRYGEQVRTTLSELRWLSGLDGHAEDIVR